MSDGLVGNAATDRNERYRAKLRRRIVTFLGWGQNLLFNDDLGARCHDCWIGEKRLNKRELEFDHVNGREWRWEQVAHYQRLKILTQEALDGKLQLVCKKHNLQRYIDGRAELDEVPF